MEKAIEDIWKLVQMPKGIYSQMKQEVYCENDWEVKNNEGKVSGALQYKVWDLGKMKTENT